MTPFSSEIITERVSGMSGFMDSLEEHFLIEQLEPFGDGVGFLSDVVTGEVDLSVEAPFVLAKSVEFAINTPQNDGNVFQDERYLLWLEVVAEALKDKLSEGLSVGMDMMLGNAVAMLECRISDLKSNQTL